MELSLHQQVWLGRIGDIHDREVDWVAFMGNVHDAAPIFGFLQPYALAPIATTAQVGMADQAHILAFYPIGCTGAHPDPLRVIAFVVDSTMLATYVVHLRQ